MPSSYRWPLSRQMALGRNGVILPGARAYFFDAGTTDARTVYSDGAQTTPRAQPVLADADGRWPMVFMAAGMYRERVTDSYGSVLWDDDELEAVVTVTVTIPAAPAAFGTGDIKFLLSTTLPSGWLFCNGRTIGNALSGASGRANADTSALFAYLYANFPDATLAVSGGRGASASADYAANKTIVLPDFRGRALVGLDDMGATTAGRLASLGATATTLLGTGGAETHTLTLAQSPAHDHGGATGADGAETITLQTPSGAAATGPNFVAYSTNGASGNVNIPNIVIPDHTHTIASAGGGAAHNNLQPLSLLPVIIKL